MTASLKGCSATLGGTTTVRSDDGVAKFTDLSISAAGTCTLVFSSEDARSAEAEIVVGTPSYELTVTTVFTGGGSGSVAVSPSGTDCGDGCYKYLSGTEVTLAASRGIGSTVEWSGCTVGADTDTCKVTMNAAKAVTATFDLATFDLTVTVGGSGSGTVTSDVPGINCGAICSATYPSTTPVQLTAVATGGSTFTGWGGDWCSGTGTCTVTMDAAKLVSATFTAPPPTFDLTVAKAGTGSGTVTSSPAGISCGLVCTAPFSGSVTLSAAAAAGSTFTGWSGACTVNLDNTCTATMDVAKSVTATFAPTGFNLSVEIPGGGGFVESAGLEISCGTEFDICSATFSAGSTVTLTATANNAPIAMKFVGWGGACSGTALTCEITVSGPTTVTATFGPAPALLAGTLRSAQVALTERARH